jgi:hypothetical protein
MEYVSTALGKCPEGVALPYLNINSFWSCHVVTGINDKMTSHTGLRTPCGCAVAQAVSFQSLSVETKGQSQASLRRIPGGTIGIQATPSPRTLLF